MSTPDQLPPGPGDQVWHVFSCKPRQESIVEDHLRRQNFEVYKPRIATRQHRKGRWHESVQALFPRYLFVRVDRLHQAIAPIRSTRGVVGLVRFCGEPAEVSDEVIAAIRGRELDGTGLHSDPTRQFQSGERIVVLDGPLACMAGLFASDDGERRAVILMELLGKTNSVWVSRDWIARVA